MTLHKDLKIIAVYIRSKQLLTKKTVIEYKIFHVYHSYDIYFTCKHLTNYFTVKQICSALLFSSTLSSTKENNSFICL